MIEIENIELSYLSLDDYEELKEAMIKSYTNIKDFNSLMGTNLDIQD